MHIPLSGNEYAMTSFIREKLKRLMMSRFSIPPLLLLFSFIWVAACAVLKSPDVSTSFTGIQGIFLAVLHKEVSPASSLAPQIGNRAGRLGLVVLSDGTYYYMRRSDAGTSIPISSTVLDFDTDTVIAAFNKAELSTMEIPDTVLNLDAKAFQHDGSTNPIITLGWNTDLLFLMPEVFQVYEVRDSVPCALLASVVPVVDCRVDETTHDVAVVFLAGASVYSRRDGKYVNTPSLKRAYLPFLAKGIFKTWTNLLMAHALLVLITATVWTIRAGQNLLRGKRRGRSIQAFHRSPGGMGCMVMGLMIVLFVFMSFGIVIDMFVMRGELNLIAYLAIGIALMLQISFAFWGKDGNVSHTDSETPEA